MMKLKKYSLLILILPGLMILAACAPEVQPETGKSDPIPADIQEPSAPYPYPAPSEEIAAPPDDLNEAYPPPQVFIPSVEPYPGVEVIKSASNRDLSEAITLAEFAVLSSDVDLQYGPVYIEHMEIILKESNPVQVELLITGNLPTPCHQLRVVNAKPDEKGHIEIQAYTLSNPDTMCTQVLEPFTAIVPLGENAEGTYTFSINNEIKREFKLP
jgi:hypothetical protein